MSYESDVKAGIIKEQIHKILEEPIEESPRGGKQQKLYDALCTLIKGTEGLSEKEVFDVVSILRIDLARLIAENELGFRG